MTNTPRPSGSFQKEAEFFGRLMQIKDLSHLTCLRQYLNSGCEHKNLNTLYEEVIDHVDTIIESWQGLYGLIEIMVPADVSQNDAITAIKDIYSYIQAQRGIFKESWLQNEIDNVCTLLAQTLYRLQYIK